MCASCLLGSGRTHSQFFVRRHDGPLLGYSPPSAAAGSPVRASRRCPRFFFLKEQVSSGVVPWPKASASSVPMLLSLSLLSKFGVFASRTNALVSSCSGVLRRRGGEKTLLQITTNLSKGGPRLNLEIRQDTTCRTSASLSFGRASPAASIRRGGWQEVEKSRGCRVTFAVPVARI